MAHSLSARKRVRQNLKHRARNRARKSLVKTQIKRFETAAQSGNVDQAAQELRLAIQKLDKVSTTSTIHRNKAARLKSRLQKKYNALQTH